ncbi:hypothetical protein V1512DRAFT_255997 [Lipomyces arxii]|uniref:uncharacterized protein n=1 Tax=Lipomyces arxii TaxID=56418 RepID=UPI0034D014FE
MPESIDGDLYVRNLASFIRANERQLASTRRSVKDTPSIFQSSIQNLTVPSRSKTARISLTPHHLFYLLYRFKDLGLSVGPMSIRLETIQPVGSPSSYVSFLHDSYQRTLNRPSDVKSLQSVSSMRSTMSGMSAIFSIMSFSSKEKIKATTDEDLKYLYSAFTKIPALRLSRDPKAKVIDGFEEFPFDRAVPLVTFKNLSSLDLVDVDIRAFFGWDTVSEKIRTLTIKRGQMDDPIELISDLVLDDMDRRRSRTSTPVPTYAVANEDADKEVASTLLERKTSRSRARTNSLSQVQSLSASPARVRSMSRSSTVHRRSNSMSSTFSATSTLDAMPTGNASLTSSNWQFLKHLSLSDNGISCVSNESMIPLGNSLATLDLSHNLLISIPEALSFLSLMTSLNFSHNLVSSLHSLAHYPLPAITALNLRGNRLTSLAGLDRIVSLERLDLRDNKLTDPTELARLTGAPNLSEIWVLGNPFVKSHSSYRITIFNLFRNTPGYDQDILLDGNLPGILEQRQLDERVEESVPLPVAKMSNANESVSEVTAVKSKEEDEDLLPMIKGFSFLKNSNTLTKPKRTPSPQRAPQKKDQTENLMAAPTAIRPPPAIKITNPTPRAKRRPGRRRVVELDSPDSGDDQMSTKTSGSAISSLKSPKSFSPPSMPPPDEHDWARQGEEYRKRVESLRNDFGSGWLSVLSEEL